MGNAAAATHTRRYVTWEHQLFLPDIPGTYQVWVATVFLPGAIARDMFGDPNAAGRALLH